jgi:hypothetical protein
MLKVVKTFLKWLELINNSNVRDLVALVKSNNAVLNQFCKLYSRFNGVGHTFDCNLAATINSEQVMRTFEVSANANLPLDSDFIWW